MNPLTSFVFSSPYLVWGPLVLITVGFLGLMAVFGVLVATHGLPRNPRVANLGNAGMSQFFLEYFYWLQKPVGPVAVKFRIHPDVLSWTSLVLQLGAAVAGQSGDVEGLSTIADADSESVAELVEEGQAYEAEVVSGVEHASDAEEQEVTTEEVSEDDIPPEYGGSE